VRTENAVCVAHRVLWIVRSLLTVIPCQIRYQFGTHDYDISFGIELIGTCKSLRYAWCKYPRSCFAGEDEGVTVLREFERVNRCASFHDMEFVGHICCGVNSHVEPVVGRCTVKAKGSVRLVWDNTFR
jgi:hypothetical protein